ncbi:MAG TPA: type VII secretion-associated serine protease mycosin [Micromonosporaceae bacterium]|jgi:type VII secretion-associated serine protease mycosin
MKGSRMRGGRTLFAIAGLLAAAAATVASPPPAYAAASCASPPEQTQPIRAVPWAQRWFASDRLVPITDGRGVVVAVIDSGVDARHPQLRGRVLPGKDFLDPGPGNDGRLDCVGHGTAVASIIAATKTEGMGLRGIAPGAEILPVRVSEQEVINGEASGRTVSPARFAEAIRWAADHGADVLNLSVVLYEDVPAVREAVRYAIAKDVVVVAAVGNLHQQRDPRPYPAAYDSVIGVGAIGQDGLREEFSQVGSYVDIVAPGGGVTVATPGRGHAIESGTSYAAPFVSAAAALIRRLHAGLSAADVRRRLEATADPSPGGRDSAAYGAGVVDPYRAAVDLIGSSQVNRPAPLPPPRVDPAAAAARARSERARERALWFALAGAAAAALATLGSVVLPSGVRRRWRPATAGRAAARRAAAHRTAAHPTSPRA